MDRRSFLKGVMAWTVAGVLVDSAGARVVTAEEMYIQPLKMKPVDEGLMEVFEHARRVADEQTGIPRSIWSDKLLSQWYDKSNLTGYSWPK
jgi:hypothetical protein